MSKSTMIENVVICIKRLHELQLLPLSALPLSSSHSPPPSPSHLISLSKRHNLTSTPKSAPSRLYINATEKSLPPKRHAETPIGMKRKRIKEKSISLPIIIEMSGLSMDQKQLIKDYHDKIGKDRIVKLSSNQKEKFTHLILSTNGSSHPPARTIKYLLGILYRAHIVSFEWFLSSLAEGGWRKEADFLIKDHNYNYNHNHPSSNQNSLKFNDYGLFHGQSFHVSGTFANDQPKKQEIIDLIKAGDGKVISRKSAFLNEKTIIIQGNESFVEKSTMEKEEKLEIISMEKRKFNQKENKDDSDIDILPSSPFPLISSLNVHDWNCQSTLSYGSNPKDYRFLRQIGKGTYGIVYLAKHYPTNTFVAIKRVPLLNEKCYKKAYNELNNHLVGSRAGSMVFVLSLYNSFRDKPSLENDDDDNEIVKGEEMTESQQRSKALNRDFLKKLLKSQLIKERRSTRFLKDPIKRAKRLNELLLKYRGPFLYLVMEHVKWGTLSDLLEEFNSNSSFDKDKSKNHNEKRGLPTVLVKRFAIQLYEAIHYLHLHNIVHRDLKPDNIFITKRQELDSNPLLPQTIDQDEEMEKSTDSEEEEEGKMEKSEKGTMAGLQIKIGDFGLSYLLSNPNQRLTLFSGTAGYLPPETINGKKGGYGICVDWFSYGVIIYRMITGSKAFPGHTAKERNERVMDPNYPNLSLVSDPLAKDLLSRLLEKNEKKRLGCNSNDETMIIRHAFFTSIGTIDIKDKIKINIPINEKLDQIKVNNGTIEIHNIPLLPPKNTDQNNTREKRDHFKDEL